MLEGTGMIDVRKRVEESLRLMEGERRTKSASFWEREK